MNKKNLAFKQQISKFYNDSVEKTKSILMEVLERSPRGYLAKRQTGVFNLKLSNDGSGCEELSQQFKRLLNFMNLCIVAANHRNNALAQLQEFLQSE